ncbi:amidase [Allopusillimonas ginsengisoli]|uniref:amidase n=1 Tax=Allopusillimonas ginsengisoli TaxID=453575 RepID=UPI001020B2D9|nr:amidase [Allopusillimonas ginsengisoli]TEA79477.1 amidase [Allopusillimonas ginsengisoli]
MKFEEYRKYDAIGLADLVRTKQVSALDLLETAIRRVEDTNAELNAVVQKLYDSARTAIEQGLPTGPFHGVPLLLKDTMSSLAGTVTQVGCQFLADNVANEDGELVARYKRAGFVIFGKTNVPELELSSSTEPALYGPAHNPWDLSRSTGGSSGGAAAAVASGMVPVAHGGDGGGSIRVPSAHCGVFGLKPTRGRTPSGPGECMPRGGLSVAHVITRTVRDSAAILDASDGYELGAPYAAPPKARPYLQEVSITPRKLRVALVTRPFIDVPVHDECTSAALAAADQLRSLGHDVVDAHLEAGIPSWREGPTILVATYLRRVLEDRAAMLGRELRPDDLEPLTWNRLIKAGGFSGVEYLRALKIVHSIGQRVASFMADYDLILTPATPSPPFQLGVMSMSSTDVSAVAAASAESIGYSQFFNAAGNPAASLPWTINKEGLPIGVQLVARFADEATLLQVSAQLEMANPWAGRIPPLFN